MRITTPLVAALAIFSSTLSAQVTVRERIEIEIAEKQRLMREGKVVRSNVRAHVRLQNGSRLRGVVRHGRFVERVSGLDFVPTDRSARGAGIRLWYYDQTNSYIFLPFSQIKDYRIGERLTDQEVKEIARQFDEAQKRAAELARERAAERATARAKAAEALKAKVAAGKAGKKGDATDGKDTAGKTGAAGSAGVAKAGANGGATKQAGATAEAGDDGDQAKGEYVPGLSPDQTALLAEFPPEDGWGPDRYQEIESRKIRVGVFPNETEQKFLDNFDSWQAALTIKEAYEAEQAQVGATPPGGVGGQTPPSTGGVIVPKGAKTGTSGSKTETKKR